MKLSNVDGIIMMAAKPFFVLAMLSFPTSLMLLSVSIFNNNLDYLWGLKFLGFSALQFLMTLFFAGIYALRRHAHGKGRE